MIDVHTWKKLWALLSARERRNAWCVLGVIILGAFSAALMVGSVMPFLAVLADPSRINTTTVLAWAYDFFSFTSVYSFLIALGLASFSIIVVSSLIQIVKAWAMARFTMMRVQSISHRLLTNYLCQPYEFFLNRNSGEMGPRVLSESEQVVTRFLQPAAELIASCLTTLAIVVLLIWIEPEVAFFSFISLGGMYGLIFLLARRFLKDLGRTRVKCNRERFRVTNEALTGVKDIKLLGREASYLDQYGQYSTQMAQADVGISVLSQVPQLALQAVALGGVILLCLVLIDAPSIATGDTMKELLPILGVFAFAGQRLLPELSKIYSSMAQMQAGAASVDIVHQDLMLRKSASHLSRAFISGLGLKHTLRLDAISYSYPNSEQTGLRNISISIQAGEKIGIVGTTGAGKTTIADIILGLLQPDEGRLVVDETDITSVNLRPWMQSLGYVPQDIFLTDASVSENIALGVPPASIDFERIRKAASIAQIDQFILDELPQGYETFIGERGIRLSGGQRQRIGIARALYNDADLIIFDEATSALDNLTEREVMSAIEALPGDKTVLMIAHRLSTVKRCDRIVVLDKGRVVGNDSWINLMAENSTFQRIARIDDAA